MTNSRPAHTETSSRPYELYRQAGLPGTRKIAEVSQDQDRAKFLHLRDSISHEGVSAILRGKGIPYWSKVECLVRILTDRAVGRPDVDVTVMRFHSLWLSAAGVDLATLALPEAQPSTAEPSITAEATRVWRDLEGLQTRLNGVKTTTDSLYM